jgi:drug/metabolite transporter (DMT)-like permease
MVLFAKVSLSHPKTHQLIAALLLFVVGTFCLAVGNQSMSLEHKGLPTSFSVWCDGAALLAGLGLAVCTHHENEARQTLPTTLSYTIWKLLLCGGLLLLLSFSGEQAEPSQLVLWMQDSKLLYRVLFVALIPGLFSLGLVSYTSKYLPPLVVATVQGAEPGLAILLSWCMGSDPPQSLPLEGVVGCILVIVGCFWTMQSLDRTTPSEKRSMNAWY